MNSLRENGEWVSLRRRKPNANKHGSYYPTLLVQLYANWHTLQICRTIYLIKIKTDKNISLITSKGGEDGRKGLCNISGEGNM